MEDGGIPHLNHELLQLMREANQKTGEAVVAIGELATVVSGLVVDRDARRRRDRWILGAASVVILAIFGAGGISYSNGRVIDALEDCTRPGGECYNKSQERTAGIIGPIRDSLGRIEQRGNDNRRLLCAGVDPDAPEQPTDLCPPGSVSPTTIVR